MPSKLRQHILNANDLETRIEKIPEWKVEIELRALNGEQLGHLLASIPSNGDGKIDTAKAGAAMLIEMAHDPRSGEKIFDIADRDSVSRKNAKVLNRLNKIMMVMNGMDEESTKNGSGASDTSSIASPKPSEAVPSPS